MTSQIRSTIESPSSLMPFAALDLEEIGDSISIQTEASEFDGRAPRAQLFFQIKP
ncbi:MAG: hypothetical protein WCJ99_04730 [Betaproteobacteria bacterium]